MYSIDTPGIRFLAYRGRSGDTGRVEMAGAWFEIAAPGQNGDGSRRRLGFEYPERNIWCNFCFQRLWRVSRVEGFGETLRREG